MPDDQYMRMEKGGKKTSFPIQKFHLLQNKHEEAHELKFWGYLKDMQKYLFSKL